MTSGVEMIEDWLWVVRFRAAQVSLISMSSTIRLLIRWLGTKAGRTVDGHHSLPSEYLVQYKAE